MIIKRYIQFISESNIEDFNSLGEWVESLMDDEYIRNKDFYDEQFKFVDYK